MRTQKEMKNYILDHLLNGEKFDPFYEARPKGYPVLVSLNISEICNGAKRQTIVKIMAKNNFFNLNLQELLQYHEKNFAFQFYRGKIESNNLKDMIQELIIEQREMKLKKLGIN